MTWYCEDSESKKVSMGWRVAQIGKKCINFFESVDVVFWVVTPYGLVALTMEAAYIYDDVGIYNPKVQHRRLLRLENLKSHRPTFFESDHLEDQKVNARITL
jgi:hypothetical protein